MQFYTVSVQLAGDRNQVVMNKGPVSVAEIAVLQAIHGKESIADYRLADTRRINHAELREELSVRYRNATPGQDNPLVEQLFGPMGALPTTLSHLGIDAKAEAERLRASAKAALAAADKLSTVGDDSVEDDAFLADLDDAAA